MAVELSDETVVVVDLKAMKAAPMRPAWSAPSAKKEDPGHWDALLKKGGIAADGSAEVVLGTRSRVYVSVRGKLLILDAETGATLGSVGNE